MQRFLIFVGVAVVAAAMYVAASPASQQAKGPSAKQFNALQKQVAALKKDKTAVKKLSVALATIVGGLLPRLNGNLVTLPVSHSAPRPRASCSAHPAHHRLSATGQELRSMSTRRARPRDLQEVNPSCLSSSGLKHGTGRAGVTRLRLWTATLAEV